MFNTRDIDDIRIECPMNFTEAHWIEMEGYNPNWKMTNYGKFEIRIDADCRTKVKNLAARTLPFMVGALGLLSII